MIEPQAGDRVAPHVVLDRPMIQGGTGSVWIAHHETLKVAVAVKLLSPELVHDETARARFAREAAAAMEVQSPHVVQILDYGISEQNVPYLVMELLMGQDLEGLLGEQGPLPPADVVSIVTQIAKGLQRAHDCGVIHRDVKSSNVFLARADGWSHERYFAKLVDFGMAKHVDRVTRQLTEQGTIVGTPQYMSPEQMMGLDLDARSDLWSLGVVAFEALTGRRPFQGESLKDFGDAIHKKPLPRPSEAMAILGPAIDEWFFKACARNPDERFASARELAEALQTAVTGTVVAMPTMTPPEPSGPIEVPFARPKVSKRSVAIVVLAIAVVCLLIVVLKR